MLRSGSKRHTGMSIKAKVSDGLLRAGGCGWVTTRYPGTGTGVPAVAVILQKLIT